MSPLFKNIFNNMHTSFVCAGIDPDISKIPQHMIKNNDADTIYEFLIKYIDIVSPNVSAFKPQKAFFDVLNDGHCILKSVIEYIHKNHTRLPVLLDCKIGDIDNTMAAYATNIFDKLDADGVFINPYMGDDVINAFQKYPEKIIAILAKTSNSSASIIQDQILSNGNTLWMHVLEQSISRWNKNGNIIPVLSSVPDLNLMYKIRDIVPNTTPIFYAGIGAQGKSIKDAKYFLNKNNSGILVNSSRGLMYPNASNEKNWSIAVKNAAIDLQNKLNELRSGPHSKFLMLGGVSGVGKTTIIHELKKLDSRFAYVSPDITRPLRDSETDKIYINENELLKREKNGEYLVVNRINNVSYGTPKQRIMEYMNQGYFPILDFPIYKTDILQSFCGHANTFVAYIKPPSLQELKKRLGFDNRDPDGKRFALAYKELDDYNTGKFDGVIDISLISTTNDIKILANNLYDAFLKSFDNSR
jgi:orotidine-5'-phosphate decarboxylase